MDPVEAMSGGKMKVAYRLACAEHIVAVIDNKIPPGRRQYADGMSDIDW